MVLYAFANYIKCHNEHEAEVKYEEALESKSLIGKD